MARAKKATTPGPVQSSTIRDFFSGRASLDKHPKKTPPVVKRPKSEVIVIESSDDESTEVKPPPPRKRRKLSTSSDDIEIVDYRRIDISEPGTSRGAVRGTSLALSQTKLSTSTTSLPALSNLNMFGKPNHLLGGLSPPTNASSDGSLGTVCSTNLPSEANSHFVDIDLSNEPEDEWATGDDELAHLILEDGDPTLQVADDFPEEIDAFESDNVSFSGPPSLRSCDGKTAPSSNAFSVLMSSNKDREAWKEATEAEDPTFRAAKSNGGRRKAPFYKILQGMPIAVDAFRYGKIPGVTAYFLTHAHSDHYTNLSSNWSHGPIYCSEGTANLIIHMLSVDRKWVHPLPMDTPTIISNTGGVCVTLIEANHCPGSCLFFFEGQQTVNAGDSAYTSPHVGSKRPYRYLHCGDFRASPQHVLHPAVKGKHIDHVYLDTTYLDPKYTFPPQPLVISACAELARRLSGGQSCQGSTRPVTSWMQPSPAKEKGKNTEDSTLFVVGTYSIGKERIVKAIANALKTKVYCDKRKTAILMCQDDPALHALLTSNPLEARVHLVPLGVVSSDKLKGYVERFKKSFSKAVGFRPTGWTYTQPAGTDMSPSIDTIISRSQSRSFTYSDLRPVRNSTAALQVYPVPYSEHSSFFELTCFAMSFEWGRMIATVNVGSETSRAKMAKWVQKWEAERRKKGKGAPVVSYRKVDYW
ncbi:hypothetical protein CCMSSC00406_0007729 [Pleurotus cornucopiae]|uniref:Uncharacterized protein n=1 Tax=Pleurotus cornucopiae TaxID=5321 RepID=A0ACB7J009_PLECO|nr:hypothetical protein CCMSSC00406_0007729 [Pleurotus cornucopiae]